MGVPNFFSEMNKNTVLRTQFYGHYRTLSTPSVAKPSSFACMRKPSKHLANPTGDKVVKK